MADKKVPKIISITAKCSDKFSMSVMDANEEEIADYHGYVPSFIGVGGGDYVEMEIDIETGRILEWNDPSGDNEFDAILEEGSEDPNIISISAKCSDGFGMSVMDANRRVIASYHGYVPSFIGVGGGDYVEMEIDIETGRILEWNDPSGDNEFDAILEGGSEGSEGDYESDG